jgi:hypothetical protein
MYGVKLDGLPLVTGGRNAEASGLVRVYNKLVTDAKYLFGVFRIWNHNVHRREFYKKLMVAQRIEEIS